MHFPQNLEANNTYLADEAMHCMGRYALPWRPRKLGLGLPKPNGGLFAGTHPNGWGRPNSIPTAAKLVFVASSFDEPVHERKLPKGDGPHSPVCVAFNSRNEMVVGNDGYYGGPPEKRNINQLFLYRKPLEKLTPDAVIELPLGAPGEIAFDAQDNLIVQALLRPCPGDWLTAYAVSTRANNPRHEGPENIEPAAARMTDAA